MRKSVYKDILDFLILVHGGHVEGNFLRRLQLLTSLIHGCVTNKNCTLEALSEPNEDYGPTKKDSSLVQTKRWLSNKWVDFNLFYLPFAQYLIEKASKRGELLFVVDGSQVGSSHTCLIVSIIVKGFSIPVAWVVKKGEKGHFSEDTHLELMKMFHQIVPPSCRVVLLGDGEFDGIRLTSWCNEQNWEFAMRTASNRNIDCGGEIAPFNTIAADNNHSVVFIPDAILGANGVFWHEKGYKDPIYLITNMELAEMACKYYKKRFKIESMFKQLKSKGFQLHKTQLQSAEKISNLIIVVAIAFCFTYCLGYFLKKIVSIDKLLPFVRKCKIKSMGYILLAQKIIQSAFQFALDFFSHISKNFDWVFT